MMDYIQSLDWPFLLKLLFLYFFWLIVSKIYNSKWLHLNKKEYEPDLSNLSRLTKPLANNFFNEGILFYVFSLLFGILGLLGFITLLMIFWDGIKGFEHRMSYRSIWVQMGSCMGIIVILYIFHGYLTKKFKENKRKI